MQKKNQIYNNALNMPFDNLFFFLCECWITLILCVKFKDYSGIKKRSCWIIRRPHCCRSTIRSERSGMLWVFVSWPARMIPDFVTLGSWFFGEFVPFCTVISLKKWGINFSCYLAIHYALLGDISILFRSRMRVKVLEPKHKGQDIRGPRSDINLLSNVTPTDFDVFCFCKAEW